MWNPIRFASIAIIGMRGPTGGSDHSIRIIGSRVCYSSRLVGQLADGSQSVTKEIIGCASTLLGDVPKSVGVGG